MQELGDMAEVLRDCLKDVDRMRELLGNAPNVLPDKRTIDQYEALLEAVVCRWNAALKKHEAVTLPRLCRYCGKLVQGKQPSNKRGEPRLPSDVCSNKNCRGATNTANGRLSAKLQGSATVKKRSNSKA